jgi:hypothetical protein
VRRDRIEPDLGSAKHDEDSIGSHRSPRQVHEALARRAVNVRASQVGVGWWRDDAARQRPRGIGHVSWDETKEILLALSALDRHMNVLMSIGKVRAWTTSSAGQIGSVNPNQHWCILAGRSFFDRHRLMLTRANEGRRGLCTVLDYEDTRVGPSLATMAGSAWLIGSRTTASAMSSYGVGSAFTMTTAAP